MKKLLLSLVILSGSFFAQSQVVVAGVSPAAIQGNYVFGNQVACAQWPGEVDDGTWGLWNGGLDFNIPGDYIQGELMIVEDGTPGVNPQGVDSTYEGCNAVINDLTGKIALVYRNTCWFSAKVYYAQQAGAIGVIIINREDAIISMLGNTDPINGPLGADCNIPAVFISDIDGAALVQEMQNGPVEMFIGNKLGAFANDAGSEPAAVLISSYGGSVSDIDNGFDIGIEVYNFGSNAQAALTVTANIDGPSGNVYNQTINAPAMNSGDTLSIFNGNPYAFPPFDLGGVSNYPAGDYTLSYSIDLGIADDFSFDNYFESTFTVHPDVLSLSKIDAAGMPIATSYPSNSNTEYQSCMFFVDPNASNLVIGAVTFIPHTDTSVNELAGAQINVNVYEWNDPWIDLTDPAYVGGANNDWFAALNPIDYVEYYPASNAENNMPTIVTLSAPLALADNQRYLFCIQGYDPVISFGYDGGLNYDANQGISAMPISPVYVDDTWYTGGWNGSSATSIALNKSYVGIEEANTIDGVAYPNPAKDNVSISIEATGNATLTVTDVTGKVVMNDVVALVDGKSNVNIASFDAGVYIFTVVFEDGQTSQFNVVKK